VFGNHVVQLGVHRPHRRLEITAESEVDVRPHRLPEASPAWADAAATTAGLVGAPTLAVSPYLSWSSLVSVGDHWQALLDLFEPEFEPGRPVLEAATGVCRAIFTQFEFDPLSTDVSTPLATVLDQRGGVCQDFAHLAIAVFRQRGIAARYVSGYIETDPPPGEPKSIGADASHAWCAIWVPETGWVDLDPTNDQLPTRRHVTVAWGRDYADIAPVRGVVIGPSAPQQLDVAVDVTRI
jgi:transglutaminase-like putative cysteine protease